MHPIIEASIDKVLTKLSYCYVSETERRERDAEYGPKVTEEQKKVVERWEKEGHPEGGIACFSWRCAQVIIKERYSLDFYPPTPYSRTASTFKNGLDDKDVYFARAGNGLTKIGMSHNVNNRITALKREVAPSDLHIIRVIPEGGRSMEQALHHEFRYLRACGEWFFLDMDDTTITEL